MADRFHLLLFYIPGVDLQALGYSLPVGGQRKSAVAVQKFKEFLEFQNSTTLE